MISNRTRAILTLTGVFLLGGIAGAGMFHLYLQGQVRDSQSMNDPNSFRGFISEWLRLSDAQRDSLRDELGATYDDMAALRIASAEEYGEVIDTFSTRLAPQLDPDQRQLLGRLEERMRRRLTRGAVRSERRPSLVDSLDEPVPALRNQIPAPRVAVDTAGRSVTKVDPRVAPAPPRRNPPAIGLPPTLPVDSARLSAESEPETGRLRMVPEADSLRTRLALGADQLASIRQIVRETRQKTRAELKKLEGFRRLQKEALRRNLREMDQQIESLLDEQQRTEYRTYRRQLSILRHGDRREGRRGKKAEIE